MRLALLSFVLVLTACGETKAVTGNDVVEAAVDDGGDADDGSAGDTIDDGGEEDGGDESGGDAGGVDTDGGDDDGGDDDGGDDDGGDDDGGGDDGGDDDGGDDVAFELVFALDAETTIAGEPVAFSLSWTGDDDSSSGVTSYAIASDTEDPLTVDESALTATVAGEHILTATATNPYGEAVEATATLSVDPAATAELSLVLSASEVVAGETVTATLSGQDAFGNETDTDDALLTGSDGVTVEGGSLLATIAGAHTATATIGDLSTDASWVVIAGPAESVDLVLEETEIERGDDTDYEVFAVDAYGNPTDAGDIRVWADDGVTIDEDREEMTFEEEGIFNCYAEIVGTEIVDTETVLIDSSGPELVVITPERGDWGTEEETVLSGEAIDTWSGPVTVTIDGEPRAVAADGSFEATMPLNFGINTFETIASDSDVDEDGVGNQSKDIRSVLQANDFWDPDTDMEDGLVVRMWEGEGGLGQFESMADGLTDAFDLDSLVEGELFSDSGFVGFFPFGFPWSVSVTGESIDYEDITISMDATDSGTLDARVTIKNTEMRFSIGGSLGFIPISAGGQVDIEAIYIDVSITPDIEDGELVFRDITYVVPDPDGVSVTVDDSVSGLVDTAGFDMEALIEDQLVGSIEAAMDGATDGLFDGLLGSLSIAQEFEVQGMTYTLNASANDVSVDENGMTVSMQTRVTPEEILGAGAVDSVSGVPYYGFSPPSFTSGGSGTQMGLSTDVLNQMMFAFWQGGMLDQTLSAEDLGLDPGLISVLLPGLDSLDIMTTPLLPPVIVPVAESVGDNQFELQIGSMLSSIYDGEFSDEALAMNLYVSAVIPLTLSMDDAGGIAMTLGDADVGVDLAYLRPDIGLSESALEDLLGTVLAGYLPEIAGDLASIPTPETGGFSISFTGSEMAGSDVPPGYWVLNGTLD